jgi:Flp pilus assembly protein TadD
MELRMPDDYRGPFTIGLALATLGRYREALNVLNRAIECEPEAAEVFAARSTVYERLGDRRMAAEDRAHVAYLRS